jgi:hypothetical protein
MDLIDGTHVADIAAARVVMLRQYEKYEHTRADAVAALAAGRWRLAVLSARAAVGFALDTVQASHGHPERDEIRRRANLRRVVRRPADRQHGMLLLAGCPAEWDPPAYLDACGSFIDDVLKIQQIDIPGYYYGKRQSEHVTMRREWLRLAEESGSVTPLSPAAIKQVLNAGTLADDMPDVQ